MAIWAYWFFLAAGLTPEVKTAPVALGFHLAAEGATVLTLIVSGVGLLRKTPGRSQPLSPGWACCSIP